MTVRPVDAEPLPPINILYHVKRTDNNCEQDWGQDLEFVANVDGSVMLEQLIKTTLLTSSCGDPALTVGDRRPLTREDIQVIPLGVASTTLPLGIVLKSNAGS